MSIKSKKIAIALLLVITIYIGTRVIHHYSTSPKKIDGQGERTVYEIVQITDDYMHSVGRDCRKGSEEYIGFLNSSLMDADSKIKEQEWYNDFEAYATEYILAAQTSPANPILEFLGYCEVVPKEMRDKTIKQL